MRRCDWSREALRARWSGRSWRLIEEGRAPGAWNMAVDEAMLEAARRNELPPTLRLYGWSRPTLSLGRHQDPRAGIDHEFRRGRGIDLVRRPTGGRAVLHDREVTYSIALPAALARGAGVGDVYQVLSGALLDGLGARFGVRCSVFGYPPEGGWIRCSDRTERTDRAERTDPSAPSDPPNTQHRIHPPSGGYPNTEHLPSGPASCFATAAGGDGLAGFGKLVGSAQARRGSAVLQHGSVLLEVRREDWEGLFGGAGLEVALADLIGAAPEEAAARAALRAGLERGLDAAFVSAVLPDAVRSEAERLAAERYSVGCLD